MHEDPCIHYCGVLPKSDLVCLHLNFYFLFFMRRIRSRPSDRQGRFIASSKFPTNFGPTTTPITNPIKWYAWIKKEEGGVNSQAAWEREILNQDEETVEHIIFGSTEGIVLEELVPDLESINIKDHPLVPLVDQVIMSDPLQELVVDMAN